MNGMYQHSVFLQVREFIRAEIEAGEYAPGMPLPAVEELADLYGVKEKMVENAIDALANEGLLRKISEKEVYVLGDKIERNIEVLEGFTQTMLDKNLKPSFKIVSKEGGERETCTALCSASPRRTKFSISSGCAMPMKIRSRWKRS